MKSRMTLNQPYTGRIDDHRLIESVPAKVYFASIMGRKNRAKYEWSSSRLSQDRLAEGVEKTLEYMHAHQIPSDHYGVPHIVVSFPHVTSMYTWGDPRRSSEKETNIYRILLFNTDISPPFLAPALNKSKALDEVGCPMEIHILNEEMKARVYAHTAEQYMRFFVPNGMVQETYVSESNLFREYLKRKS